MVLIKFKMYFILFTIFVLAPFSQAHYEIDEYDDPVSIDEQVAPLGSDAFALFTYGSWVMPADMLQDVPSAMYYGLARLPFHRLDFSYYSQEVHGSYPTVVPDCGYEVWGSLYLIPVQDLDLVLQKGGIIDEQKHFHFLQKTVQVYVNGNVINVKCNTFQQQVLPEKLIYGLPLPHDRRPSQQIVDMLVEAYTDGGLPQKYIEEISLLPTTDQDFIETNLTPVAGQKNDVSASSQQEQEQEKKMENP